MDVLVGHSRVSSEAQWAEWNTAVQPYSVGVEEEVMLLDPGREWALAQRIEDVYRAELAAALGRRGIDAEVAASVLDRYDEVGIIDDAAFARACGAQGFTARDPASLIDTVRAFLAAPGPAVLHAVVDPDEIPSMPHIELGQVWKFGIAKVKEALAAARA